MYPFIYLLNLWWEINCYKWVLGGNTDKGFLPQFCAADVSTFVFSLGGILGGVLFSSEQVAGNYTNKRVCSHAQLKSGMMLSHISETGARLSKLLSYLNIFENPNKTCAGQGSAPQLGGTSLFNMFRHLKTLDWYFMGISWLICLKTAC